MPNATAQQSRISDIRNADFKKNVSFEKSEIVGSLPKKGLYWSHLINKTLLKDLFTHFWENVGKLLLWKFWKIIEENVFNSVHFKKFELSNPPTYNYAEGVSFVVLRNFKIAERASVVKSHFGKVREISAFCNSVEKI